MIITILFLLLFFFILNSKENKNSFIYFRVTITKFHKNILLNHCCLYTKEHFWAKCYWNFVLNKKTWFFLYREKRNNSKTLDGFIIEFARSKEK